MNELDLLLDDSMGFDPYSILTDLDFINEMFMSEESDWEEV
jgi:hypothetical protein